MARLRTVRPCPAGNCNRHAMRMKAASLSRGTALFECPRIFECSRLDQGGNAPDDRQNSADSRRLTGGKQPKAVSAETRSPDAVSNQDRSSVPPGRWHRAAPLFAVASHGTCDLKRDYGLTEQSVLVRIASTYQATGKNDARRWSSRPAPAYSRVAGAREPTAQSCMQARSICLR